MDKYIIFRQLMDLVSDHADVVDANLNTWNGGMLVQGEADGETIAIEVTIKKKEEDKDA